MTYRYNHTKLPTAKRARVAYRTRRLRVRVTTSPGSRATEFDKFSHDLRNPLTALRAGLGLLEMRLHTRLTAEEESLLSSLRQSVERLGQMLDAHTGTELHYANNGKKPEQMAAKRK